MHAWRADMPAEYGESDECGLQICQIKINRKWRAVCDAFDGQLSCEARLSWRCGFSFLNTTTICETRVIAQKESGARMILNEGNKVLIVHRRLFEHDEPRYFVGQVVAYDNGIVKTAGYSFVRDIMAGTVIRKDDPRTKVISLASGSFLVYQLPDETEVSEVVFQATNDQVVLTDGGSVQMNMSEFPHRGKI
jgi:hypothetical protein